MSFSLVPDALFAGVLVDATVASAFEFAVVAEVASGEVD